MRRSRRTHGESRNAYKMLIEKLMRSLINPRSMWKDNIIIDVRNIGFGNVNWIEVVQDKIVLYCRGVNLNWLRLRTYFGLLL